MIIIHQYSGVKLTLYILWKNMKLKTPPIMEQFGQKVIPLITLFLQMRLNLAIRYPLLIMSCEHPHNEQEIEKSTIKYFIITFL